MKWTDFDHNFCEGFIYDMPEYYNAISSIAMVIFGFIGIFNSFNDFVIKLMYGILFATGIGSIFYHWFGSIGWALFDEFPMILIVFISNLYLNEISFYIKSIYKTVTTIDNIQNAIKICINCLIMVFFLVSNVMSTSRLYFPLYFAICFVNLIYQFITLSYQFSKLKLCIENNIQIIPYAKKYLCFLMLSALFWILTENSCKYFKPNSESIFSILYLIGHPMWHITVSYSFYNLLQIILYIKLRLVGNNVKINEHIGNLYIY